MTHILFPFPPQWLIHCSKRVWNERDKKRDGLNTKHLSVHSIVQQVHALPLSFVWFIIHNVSRTIAIKHTKRCVSGGTLLGVMRHIRPAVLTNKNWDLVGICIKLMQSIKADFFPLQWSSGKHMNYNSLCNFSSVLLSQRLYSLLIDCKTKSCLALI